MDPQAARTPSLPTAYTASAPNGGILQISRVNVLKKQLKVMLSRLKNPSVVLSIASQIIAILMLLNVHVDEGIVTGIMSNPESTKKGYGDDIYKCPNCNCDCEYVEVNGKLVCKKCGTEKPQEPEQKES